MSDQKIKMKKWFLQSAAGEWLMGKLSQGDIERFCKANKTGPNEKVLIVHSDDMAYEYYFPNREKANVRNGEDIDIKSDKEYQNIQSPDNVYDVVVCTGLLEHVPDPTATLKELKRVLKSGGKLLVSASASFSTHSAPDNYFHATLFGMKKWLDDASFDIKNITPSSRPFRTIGILLQRICYQTDMSMFFKFFIFLCAKIVPFFDMFIKKDYGNIQKSYEIQSSLYSNVQVVAVKPEQVSTS